LKDQPCSRIHHRLQATQKTGWDADTLTTCFTNCMYCKIVVTDVLTYFLDRSTSSLQIISLHQT